MKVKKSKTYTKAKPHHSFLWTKQNPKYIRLDIHIHSY